MTSMSTKISDLPTPFVETQPKTTAIQTQAKPQSVITASVTPKDPQITAEPVADKPVTTVAPAGTSTQAGVVDKIRNEINEENLLLYMFFYIAFAPETDKYLQVLPASITSNTLIKAGLLLIVYILVKVFLLRYIKI